MGSAGTYVECGACGGTYDEQVLHYDPAAEQAELLTNIRYVLELVMLAAGRRDPASVTALRKWYESVANAPLTDQQVAEEMRMAESAGVRMEAFVPAKIGDLSLDGKYLVLRAARDLIAGQPGVDRRDIEVLKELGAAMKLPEANVNQELGVS